MSLMLVSQNPKDPRGALGFFRAKEKHTLVRSLLLVSLKNHFETESSMAGEPYNCLPRSYFLRSHLHQSSAAGLHSYRLKAAMVKKKAV